MRGEVLLVNPWITDFAAFDLWARPLGLLYLAAGLIRAGAGVRLIDCLDRLHPESRAPGGGKTRAAGTGHWFRTPLPTPEPLRDIPRRFARYGLPEKVFRSDLLGGPRPDLVLVTSSMTYWYPGVRSAIRITKETLPDVPVVLGGTYATLCREHAEKYSGADRVAPGPGESGLASVAGDLAGLDMGNAFNAPWSAFRPALELYPQLEFAPLLTARGCPMRCPYCASHRLYPAFEPRSAEDVIDEIEDRHVRLGLKDFTFFDDALLVDPDRRLAPVLETVIRNRWPLRFHAPNGLHVGLITPDLARLMKAAGFQTIRLGVESLDPDRGRELGDKVGLGDFETAVAALRGAGFTTDQIGGYILFGLPGQDLEEVLATARLVKRAGVRPFLAEYSPLPDTALWASAVQASPFDLRREPLYHNNTFFPCRGPSFSWKAAWEIKRRAKMAED